MHLSKPLVLLGILALVGVGVVVAIKHNAGTFTETIQNGKRVINVGPNRSDEEVAGNPSVPGDRGGMPNAGAAKV